VPVCGYLYREGCVILAVETRAMTSLTALRSAAAARGEKRFDPGTPCKHGHSALRWTASSQCEECERATRSTRRAFLDPEKKRVTQQKSDRKRNSTPERRASVRARESANREHIAGVKRRWQEANRERFRAAANGRAKRWRDRNPEAQCALAARRRAKVRAAAAGCPKSRLAYEKWARTAPRIPCYWCKVTTLPGGRHVDHIIPLARAGSDAVANLCVACPACNQRKNVKMPHEFAGQAEMALS
jgi:5-methylcytosine-specific restriction endonuclease McrA